MSATLIINADDLGYDPAVTRGILEAMSLGIVTSTTMMVNSPHSEDAGKKVHGTALGIGLHVNLARWPPISKVPRYLLGPDGGLVEGRIVEMPSEVVESETLAQLERLKALTGRAASHLDVHKHLHRHPNVLEGILRVALKHKLPLRSIDPGMRRAIQERGGVTNDGFLGEAGEQAYWTLERLRTHLFALPEEGAIELMCHPGYAPITLKSGYSAQREVELSTFVSDQAKAWLDARDLSPTSWWALHPPA
ncbi:MAG: YdjC-like protein [Myxococcaceae bacterium]|nr:YdjC-like protein [Myxococcaceae bacterium]